MLTKNGVIDFEINLWKMVGWYEVIDPRQNIYDMLAAWNMVIEGYITLN